MISHLITNIDTFHADVVNFYYQQLIPIHCSGIDGRQQGDSVAVLPHQGQHLHLAAVVINITLPPHTEVIWHKLPVQLGCPYPLVLCDCNTQKRLASVYQLSTNN